VWRGHSCPRADSENNARTRVGRPRHTRTTHWKLSEPSFALVRSGCHRSHSTAMGIDKSVKALPSKLAKTRRQVAAVCYRIRKRGIEFLLVQTRGGRWIFPKGGVEPGLTPAESAALEAFEEAGVHGRMEAAAFARYLRGSPEVPPSTDASAGTQEVLDELAVNAYLCEVSRIEKPQELNRNPTWFTAEKAKQRLLEDRASEFGAQLAGVVDRAVARIRRLHGSPSDSFDRRERERDGLYEVRFEPVDRGRLLEAAVQAHLRRARQIGNLHAANGEMRKPLLRLGTGLDTGILSNITAIDSRNGNSRSTARPKPRPFKTNSH
jgi:8-oxo-dGTP pyrophosphatase MutT (NUDIX family)